MALATLSGVLAAAAPAGAAVVTRKLTVTKVASPLGSGADGKVTSSATGATTTAILCDVSTCTTQTKTYTRYSSITITAEADASSTLVSFSSNCPRSGTSNQCTISSLASDTNVTVTFLRTPELAVRKDSVGGGSGSITATGASGYLPLFKDLGCSTTCRTKEQFNASITLTASPNDTSEFAGWVGAGCGAAPACTVAMSAARSLVATFRATYAYSVTRSLVGAGGGTLTANGATCASTCSSRAAADATMTLVAEPSSGSTFTGWTGFADPAPCTTERTCIFPMGTSARSITATFTSLERLTVDVGGADGVSVAADTGVIDCPGTCSDLYPFGTSVELTADFPEAAEFTGWTGAPGCTTDPVCTVQLPVGGLRVSAAFGGRMQLLVLHDLVGDAVGTIAVYERTETPSATPDGDPVVTLTPIDCDPTCFLHPDTVVVLEAAEGSATRWDGWTGPCAEADPTGTACTVTLASSVTVSARFVEFHTVTLHVAGASGYGGTVGGIGADPCATTCSTTFDAGESVTLVPAPENASTTFSFTGTGIGGCAAAAATCTFTADADVTVTFARKTVALSVVIDGSGTGTVSAATGAPDAIAVLDLCSEDCSGVVPIGDEVVLSAIHGAGSRFAGWTDCPDAAGTTCTVTMDAAASVTATFTALAVLTVSVAEAGGGGSISLPAGPFASGPLGCTSATEACAMTYDVGTSTVITAAPTPVDGTASMGSWVGCDSSTATSCTVAMDAARKVDVTFVPLAFALTVSPVLQSPTALGTVRSSVGGIVCAVASPTTGCTDSFVVGTSVILSAEAPAGSRFTGWGAPCSGTDTCTVTMDVARTVTASFTTIETLTVTRGGLGTGTVGSSDRAIDCGSTCTAGGYLYGTTVVLTATPLSPNVVGGWSVSACKKSTTCSVTLNGSQTVNVNFDLGTYPLTLKKAGTGTGTVSATSTTATATTSISCTSSCNSKSGTFTANAPVTLTATASSNSWFEGWEGACASALTNLTCTLENVSIATEVTARFSLPTLTITKQSWASGNGSVTATATKTQSLTCGTTCTTATKTYTSTTVVTLTATPATGSRLSGWGGACASVPVTTLTCQVTVSRLSSVTVGFGVPFDLSVAISGLGSGSVTVVTPAGTSTCTGTAGQTVSCSTPIVAGWNVKLTAAPDPTSYLGRWDGDCGGTVGLECTFTSLDYGPAAIAIFRPLV